MPSGQKETRTPIVTETKIGATVYRVTGTFSKDAKETAVDKMRRLILRDVERSGPG